MLLLPAFLRELDEYINIRERTEPHLDEEEKISPQSCLAQKCLILAVCNTFYSHLKTKTTGQYSSSRRIITARTSTRGRCQLNSILDANTNSSSLFMVLLVAFLRGFDDYVRVQEGTAAYLDE